MKENIDKYIKNLLNNIENNNIEKIDISFNRIFYVLRKKYRLFLKVFFLILLGINTHTLLVRIFNPVFKGNFTLLISDPLNRDENRPSGKFENSIEDTAFGTTKNDIPTLIAFLESSYILNPIADELNMTLKDLRDNISILSLETKKEANTNGYAGLIKVDYFSNSPKKDLKVLNLISEKFIISANELRIDKLKGGLNFLSKQEPILQAKLDIVQSNIAKFRETNFLLKPLFEGENIREEERQLLKLITSLDNDLKRLNDIKLQILNDNLITSGFEETISKKDFFDKGTYSNQGLSISSSASMLLNEFNKVDSELAKAKSIYGEESKIVQSLEERVNKIKPILKNKQIEAVESAIKFNLNKKEALELQRKRLNLKFQRMPKLISEYSVLENQKEIAEQNLTSLIDAKEKLKLEIAQNSLAWIIIEPPKFEESPIYPSIYKRVISSLFIATFICFIIALYIEKKDNSFSRVREVISKFENFLILGVVPFVKGVDIKNNINNILNNINFVNNDLEDPSKIRSNIQLESLRNIYTSINRISKEKKTFFFNVTSSIPEEGKTFLSILISFTFAQMGKKVLLVDSDLRKPKIHEFLEISNNQGLTEILLEEESWTNCIQEIDGYENLKIITTNNYGLDPVGLLSSEKFDSFIKEVKESGKFDFVFMNTTPIMGLSDPLIVSNKCDKDFLIISLEKVPKNFVYQSVKILLESYEEEKLPSIIINQVTESTNENEFEYYENYYSYLFNRDATKKNNYEKIVELIKNLEKLKNKFSKNNLIKILKKLVSK